MKLLQKDPKTHSCRVQGTMEELAPTPFACAIFEAKCRSLIFFDGENGTSELPVLNIKEESVLSSLKVGWRCGFFCQPPNCFNEAPA